MRTKIEEGDRIWFGEKDDGVTDSIVVEHLLLDTEQTEKVKKIFKEFNLPYFDALIFLKPIREIKKMTNKTENQEKVIRLSDLKNNDFLEGFKKGIEICQDICKKYGLKLELPKNLDLEKGEWTND